MLTGASLERIFNPSKQLTGLNDMNIETLKIITNEAIKTIAAAHNTTIENVKLALESGQEIVCKEFQKLCVIGFDVAK